MSDRERVEALAKVREAVEQGLRKCRVEDGAPVGLFREDDLLHISHMVTEALMQTPAMRDLLAEAKADALREASLGAVETPPDCRQQAQRVTERVLGMAYSGSWDLYRQRVWAAHEAARGNPAEQEKVDKLFPATSPVQSLEEALREAMPKRFSGVDGHYEQAVELLASDWLRDLLAEAKADVWDEGHIVCCEDYEPVCDEFHPNPYRETTTGGRLMTDETNGSGAGERGCLVMRVANQLLETDALTPNHDGTPEHYIVDAENVEYLVRTVLDLTCGCEEPSGDGDGFYTCALHGHVPQPTLPATPDADDASEPTWMRPIPEAMMNDERLDVLLSEFYHSDDGDYVSALGDIRKHVAARESAAATRARAEVIERVEAEWFNGNLAEDVRARIVRSGA